VSEIKAEIRKRDEILSLDAAFLVENAMVSKVNQKNRISFQL